MEFIISTCTGCVTSPVGLILLFIHTFIHKFKQSFVLKHWHKVSPLSLFCNTTWTICSPSEPLCVKIGNKVIGKALYVPPFLAEKFLPFSTTNFNFLFPSKNIFPRLFFQVISFKLEGVWCLLDIPQSTGNCGPCYWSFLWSLVVVEESFIDSQPSQILLY